MATLTLCRCRSRRCTRLTSQASSTSARTSSAGATPCPPQSSNPYPNPNPSPSPNTPPISLSSPLSLQGIKALDGITLTLTPTLTPTRTLTLTLTLAPNPSPSPTPNQVGRRVRQADEGGRAEEGSRRRPTHALVVVLLQDPRALASGHGALPGDVAQEARLTTRLGQRDHAPHGHGVGRRRVG